MLHMIIFIKEQFPNNFFFHEFRLISISKIKKNKKGSHVTVEHTHQSAAMSNVTYVGIRKSVLIFGNQNLESP